MKYIITKLNDYLTEGSKEDVVRDFLKDKFKEEQKDNVIIIEKQKRATNDIYLFLLDLGFYRDKEYDRLFKKSEDDFKPKMSDYVGSFSIIHFIKEYKNFLSDKYDVGTYAITDKMWNDDMNDVIIPKIKEILKKYDLELSDKDPVLYGGGDMRITLNDIAVYGSKIPQVIMNNPQKIMSTREFFGIEDRREKRKFIKHTVGGYEYKFLLNPLNQDKYFGSGDKGLFGGLFGGLLKIGGIEYEKCIIQICESDRISNFVIGGDGGFYIFEDIKKSKEDEDYPIKKIDETNSFYNDLVDLKKLHEQFSDSSIKMIVFLHLGGDLAETKNGGLFDKRRKEIYYSYILK